MRRPHSSRDLLVACLTDSLFPDGAKKRLMQSVGLQFPCRTLLHQWGKEDSPNCPFCKERESLGHIQSRCKALEKPRNTAHHMIWREIVLQLLSLSGDEGDEHKWVVPSAVSTETHKELTIRQLFHHLGFFASDAVLENAVSAFFTKSAERASAYVNQHLRDPDDPSGLILDISSRFRSSRQIAILKQIFSTDCADLLDRFRFSSEEQFVGAVPRNSTLLCPRSWISTPMDMPFTRRVNNWQFSNLLGLWIHQTTGNFRKTLRNGRGTSGCWNSLTHYQTDRVGL
jgi:hypothetical protein